MRHADNVAAEARERRRAVTETPAKVLERFMDSIGMPEEERKAWREDMGYALLFSEMELVGVLSGEEE